MYRTKAPVEGKIKIVEVYLRGRGGRIAFDRLDGNNGPSKISHDCAAAYLRYGSHNAIRYRWHKYHESQERTKP